MAATMQTPHGLFRPAFVTVSLVFERRWQDEKTFADLL